MSKGTPAKKVGPEGPLNFECYIFNERYDQEPRFEKNTAVYFTTKKIIFIFILLGCIEEKNIDYHGAESNNILEQTGLTKQGCANLAASTNNGNFWTFKTQTGNTGLGTVVITR